MSDGVISTVLIDDEVRALNRIGILLQNFPKINVIGEFEDAQEGIDFILRNEPDLVFLDVEMPGKSGLEIAADIHKNFLNTEL